MSNRFVKEALPPQDEKTQPVKSGWNLLSYVPIFKKTPVVKDEATKKIEEMIAFGGKACLDAHAKLKTGFDFKKAAAQLIKQLGDLQVPDDFKKKKEVLRVDQQRFLGHEEIDNVNEHVTGLDDDAKTEVAGLFAIDNILEAACATKTDHFDMLMFWDYWFDDNKQLQRNDQFMSHKKFMENLYDHLVAVVNSSANDDALPNQYALAVLLFLFEERRKDPKLSEYEAEVVFNIEGNHLVRIYLKTSSSATKWFEDQKQLNQSVMIDVTNMKVYPAPQLLKVGQKFAKDEPPFSDSGLTLSVVQKSYDHIRKETVANLSLQPSSSLSRVSQ